jgi:hypothetical protein
MKLETKEGIGVSVVDMGLFLKRRTSEARSSRTKFSVRVILPCQEELKLN